MIPFPDKKYDIIYADPPWSYSDKGCNGNAAEHYPTMTVDEICKMPVNVAGGIASDNCILFMWATYPMMKEALKVIEAWGFTYKSIAFQWVKQNRSGKGYFFGLGRWTRGNTEPCLLAVKGKPKRISASVGQLVFSPLRRHSQKPDEVRDRIVELMGDLPRIELFARERDKPRHHHHARVSAADLNKAGHRSEQGGTQRRPRGAEDRADVDGLHRHNSEHGRRRRS